MVEPVEVKVDIPADGTVVLTVTTGAPDDPRRGVGAVLRVTQQLTKPAKSAMATLVERAARADAHRPRVVRAEPVGERRRWHGREQLLPVPGITGDGHVVRAQRGRN